MDYIITFTWNNETAIRIAAINDILGLALESAHMTLMQGVHALQSPGQIGTLYFPFKHNTYNNPQLMQQIHITRGDLLEIRRITRREYDK